MVPLAMDGASRKVAPRARFSAGPGALAYAASPVVGVELIAGLVKFCRFGLYGVVCRRGPLALNGIPRPARAGETGGLGEVVVDLLGSERPAPSEDGAIYHGVRVVLVGDRVRLGEGRRDHLRKLDSDLAARRRDAKIWAVAVLYVQREG